MLFELIRVALGVQDCLSHSPTADEWGKLYDMAKKQSLVGVCFAGVQRLPEEVRPPEMLYLTWMGMAGKIQQRNEVVNRQCVDLQKRLSADGVRFCILKGQGAGVRYPSDLSMLRQSGDIDIWMAGGMEKVVRYVNGIAPTDEVTSSHVQLHVFEDTEVEMHYVPMRLGNRLANRRVMSWLFAQEETQMSHQVPFMDGALNVPTDEFDIVYQMLHIFKHLFNEGIGLRQLMDYYFVLCKGVDGEARLRVRKVVSGFGLDRFASALMWVMQKVFGLSMIGVPWTPNQRDGEFLLEEILQMGNFGHRDERFRLNMDDSHMKHFWQMSSSKWRFIGHFPSEVIWQPIDMFLRFFEQKALRKKAMKFNSQLDKL